MDAFIKIVAVVAIILLHLVIVGGILLWCGNPVGHHLVVWPAVSLGFFAYVLLMTLGIKEMFFD